MLVVAVIIISLVIIGYLVYKLNQRQIIDKTEMTTYQNDLAVLREQHRNLDKEFSLLQEKYDYEQYKLDECKKDLQAALDTYHDITDNKLKEIDNAIEEQRRTRQAELEQFLQGKKEYYQKLLDDTIKQCEIQDETIKEASETKWREAMEQIQKYNDSIAEARSRFEGIERTLRAYDLEQQQKLFYTIQLPEEYHEDIDFLLTTVAAKVQHPDIISKLVWTEYVKPNIEDTFKRVEVKAEPGIYKLTSLANGKCYIGKSTNVKTRIADHFKSAIGIKSIADQAVHHAILKEGFWNWQIEIITYCDKDKLSELEKYYIEFFKAQEFGYNKTGGG